MLNTLCDNDSLLKNLMQNMDDMIYFKDLQSIFVLVNDSEATWLGFSHPDEAIGRSDFDFLQPEDAQKIFDEEQRIIQTGNPLEGVEERTTWKDGTEAWVSTTKMPLKGPDGKIIGTFGVSRDITEQKAIELNAHYYAEKVRRIKEGIEEDVRMASELQKSFFPHIYPVFPLKGAPDKSCVEFLYECRASGVVSGDFCTIRRISETESAIFQCDFMGHGVRAALGTAMIFAMIEENSLLIRDPGVFLSRMNELLLPLLRQGGAFLYATACYSVFDASTGIIRTANAGHPVPLCLQGSEKRADWLIADESLRGPALAIVKAVEYVTFERQLQPRDSVVMYTDGLYEVESVGGEEFGEERLLALANRSVGLSLERLYPLLIDEVIKFSEEDELDDDVCLVGFTFHHFMED